MKKSLIMLGLVLGTLLIASVNAGIYFSQPEQAYNLGDIIINDITIDSDAEGFLKVDLVCENAAVNIFNWIPIEGQAHIEFPLTTAFIQDVSGECYFLARYSNLEQESKKFKISKNLNIRLDIDSLFAKPGEEIIISGDAKRLNGVGINGSVEISIPLLSLTNTEKVNEIDEVNESETDDSENNETEEIEEPIIESYDSGKFFGEVVNGIFSISFTLEKNIPAGDYRIDVLAYEESSGSKTSEGLAMANLKVSQILTKIEIALSLQSLDPGQELSLKPRLLDQSEQSMEEEVSIVIRDEDSKRIFEKIVPSEETLIYKIPTNLSAGYYEIEAFNSEFNEIKSFYVNEKEIVSLELINGTLIATNIGNMKLKDYSIQVELNGKPFLKKISLDLGEKQEFELTGDGTYDIRVSNGDEELLQNSVVLTGDAIGVETIKSAKALALGSPIIWIFLIIILGGVGLFFFKDVFKKKSFAYPFKERLKRRFSRKSKVLELKSKETENNKEDTIKPEQKSGGENKFSSVSTNQAERVLVLDGRKNKAIILNLTIKNKLSAFSKQNLEKAIEHVYKKKAAVYEKGNNIFIIFSPLITKTFKNELEAVKAAEKILFLLNEYNKKFKEKIDFGIGIHSGDVINKIENKKLKFTALGNFISGAKKIAEVSDKQILMSKETYEKAMNNIKATKKKIKDIEVYEVYRIIDREQNKKFISDFLNRMEREGK